MKPILCVIDLTECSRKVLEVAATIASACHAHMIVLFSYRLVDLGREVDMSTLKATMDAKAKAKFNDLVRAFLKDNYITYEFHPEIGFLADRINAYITRNEVGLVIMGEEQANEISDNKSFTFREFISDMKSPFIIVPEESNVEALLS